MQPLAFSCFLVFSEMSGWGFCCALVRKGAVAYTCPAVNTDADKTFLRLSRSTRKNEKNTYTPCQGQNEKRAIAVRFSDEVKNAVCL